MTQKKQKKNNKTELETQTAISALYNMEGGKMIVGVLVKDVLAKVDTLRFKYKELTMQEFISISAEMNTKIDLIEILTQAEGNKDYIKKLLAEELASE